MFKSLVKVNLRDADESRRDNVEPMEQKPEDMYDIISLVHAPKASAVTMQGPGTKEQRGVRKRDRG